MNSLIALVARTRRAAIEDRIASSEHPPCQSEFRVVLRALMTPRCHRSRRAELSQRPAPHLGHVARLFGTPAPHFLHRHDSGRPGGPSGPALQCCGMILYLTGSLLLETCTAALLRPSVGDLQPYSRCNRKLPEFAPRRHSPAMVAPSSDKVPLYCMSGPPGALMTSKTDRSA